MPDSRGIAVGLLVGAFVLALLFAGQVLSFAAFWLGRALTGAVILLLAFALGYGAYQLYAGWAAADSSRTAASEWDVDTDSVDEPDAVDETVNDEDLEAELDALREDTEVEDEMASETN